MTSKLWYCIAVLPVDKEIIQTIKCICIEFLWLGKSHLVAYGALIGDARNGGLNIPDILHKLYAFRLKFLGRFLNPVYTSLWKEFCKYFLKSWKNVEMYIPLFFTHCHKNVILGLPPIYVEMLSAWCEFQQGADINVISDQQILFQPLFCNPRFCSLGLSAIVNTFISAGLFCLKDLLYIVIPGFLPVSAVREIVSSKCPDASVNEIDRVYQHIVSSVPKIWIEQLAGSILPDEEKCKITFLVGN